MATDESAIRSRKREDGEGFRIANGPVVNGREDDDTFALDLTELPRNYGGPIFVAIPRDPRTLFTYWSIDWERIFATGEPIDRRVYVRVLKMDGLEESEAAVEPMLGTYYATVSEPAGSYQVELGYYQPAGTWRSVAISDSVTMPPEAASEDVAVDVATVPFHLSFQKIIDLFRASNGDSVTTLLSHLQHRALRDDERDLLSPEEWEIIRAMNLSLSEIEAARRTFSDSSTVDRLRKRAEAILGFGATSPTGAFGPGSPTDFFGGSSWS